MPRSDFTWIACTMTTTPDIFEFPTHVNLTKYQLLGHAVLLGTQSCLVLTILQPL